MKGKVTDGGGGSRRGSKEGRGEVRWKERRGEDGKGRERRRRRKTMET